MSRNILVAPFCFSLIPAATTSAAENYPMRRRYG